MDIKNLCVYCGANAGVNPVYAAAARELAAELVKRNIGLVYGGGNVGLMGIIADEVLKLGGRAVGVIPQALIDMEVAHLNLTEQHIVRDMHERKAMMAALSDGFIAMPGGLGTLEELFEMLTWAQLKFHAKKIGLLNVNGYYDGLIAFVQHQVSEGFVKPAHQALMLHETQPAALIARLL